MCVGLMVGDSKNKKSEQEYENWWCQGKEIEKVSNVPPTVKVLWDAMLVDLEEDISTSNQVLQPKKWKKKSEFGWRMDIDVELFENYHDMVDENVDAEDYTNLNVDDDDSNDDIQQSSDSDDGEESVLDYGTDSSDSDSD